MKLLFCTVSKFIFADEVLPPVVKTDSSQLYVVDLSWNMPLKPNGNLLIENRYSELYILTCRQRFCGVI
jgi:hypothetical protein